MTRSYTGPGAAGSFGNNPASQEFVASLMDAAASLGINERTVRDVLRLKPPRRPFTVTFTVRGFLAHDAEHARQMALHCARGGFGARADIEVGEVRG